MDNASFSSSNRIVIILTTLVYNVVKLVITLINLTCKIEPKIYSVAIILRCSLIDIDYGIHVNLQFLIELYLWDRYLRIQTELYPD